MVYLLSLKKYAILFLKTTLFFAAGLLLYLFTMLVALKFKGETALLLEALKNYGLFIIYSLPLVIMVSSCFFFGSAGNDKKFILRMIPIVSSFNTIFLFIFFLVKIDFQALFNPTQLYFSPDIKEGIINSVGDYKVFVEKSDKNSIKKGILFYRNVYFISDGRVLKNEVNVNTYQYISAVGLNRQNSSFSIPRKEPVIQVKETGIAHFLFQNYIGYLKKLSGIFYTTFVNGGLINSIIAIYLLSVGFFAIICGVTGFLSEKQIMILTYSTLFTVALLMFIGFPYFLSLIALIKFGIKIGFFRVVIPGLFVGLFAALIGYALIELRFLLIKNAGNR